VTGEIEASLEDRSSAFHFFQAVRLLERLHPERSPVGHFVPPLSEVVRFSVPASLAFPPADIESFEWNSDGPAEMEVNFLGLTGPSGVLPLYYTELMESRIRQGDKAYKDFIDIFNHRFISFLYRAWRKYRLTLGYETRGAEADRFSLELLTLVGLGTAALQNRQEIPDEAFIYYAGLLMPHSRSATLLKQLVADYFDIEVEIEEFSGSWYKLDPQTQTTLDDSANESSQLGVGVIAGDEIWQDESTVRIKIGPLPIDRYVEFLPGGRAYRDLQAWTRFFSGNQLDFELQLVLKKEEVPACELGREGTDAPRLGWITWVKSAPFKSDSAETVFRL